jgi:hypothetical protein
MKQSVILAALGALAAVAIHAEAQVIDFTAAEGYANGPLHTQIGYKWWSSDAPTAWQVDTSGSGHATISSSLGDWKKITYNMGPALTSGYTGSFDLSFTLGAAATGTTTLFDFGLQDSANSWKGPALELKAQPGGGFSMDIWNNVSSTFTSTGISGTDMGLSPGGTGTTANLRLGFTTTPVGLNAWTTVLSLQNLNTSTELGTLTQNWTGQGWLDVIAMEEAQLNTLSGTSGSISVDRIAIAVVPEPAGGVMLLGGLAMLTIFRRRRA